MITRERLIEQIVSMQSDFHSSRDAYENLHPEFNIEIDARITIFSRCIALLDIALLYLMFRTFQLPSVEWWSGLPDQLVEHGLARNLNSNLPPDRFEIMNVVDLFWSTIFFISFYSVIESSARAIARGAFPIDDIGANGDLSKIYKVLLSTNFEKYESMLELFRLSRNTLHNNGVYFPKKKGDNRTISYNGIKYDFIESKIVQLRDVANLLFFEIVPDLLKLINDIVNSPSVSGPKKITDPALQKD